MTSEILRLFSTKVTNSLRLVKDSTLSGSSTIYSP